MIRKKTVKLLSKDYPKVRQLMKTAFPKEERTSVLFLRVLSLKKSYRFEALYEDEAFIGFLYYLESSKYVGILYIAIADEVRSKGYGGKVVDLIKEQFEKPIVLNIGIPSEDVQHFSKKDKLLSFYGRHGIVDTGYSFTYRGTEYWALCSSNDDFEKDEYEKFCYRASLGAARYKLVKREYRFF